MSTALLRLEWALFARAWSNRFTVFALCLFAISAIIFGDAKLQSKHAQQQRVLAAAAQELSQKRAQLGAGVDAGDFAYYQFYPVPKPLSPWQALSSDTSDASITRIRLLGLQGQLYDGSVQNPEPLAFGRFDYAFVAIALMPLALIAVLFNVRADDEAGQRIRLIQIYARRWKSLYQGRYLLRLLTIFLATLVPLWLYAAWRALSWQALGLLSVAIVVYGMVWYLIIVLLLQFFHRQQRRPQATALAGRLLIVWLAIVFIAPQATSSWGTLAPNSASGPEIALAHRKSVADAWDLPKEVRFRRFFEEHPEWQNTPPVLVRFHWKWYYAFHHVADMDVRGLVNQRLANQLAQQRQLETASVVVFPLALQSVFERLSGQHVQQKLAHVKCIEKWHSDLRRYFYPLVFEGKKLTVALFDRIPQFDRQACVE
jgi:ABC-2 type transport system permease protein